MRCNNGIDGGKLEQAGQLGHIAGNKNNAGRLG
jgi:hypothetical protein